jgi:hypothetical protein
MPCDIPLIVWDEILTGIAEYLVNPPFSVSGGLSVDVI